MKILSPMSGFTAWGSGKRTMNLTLRTNGTWWQDFHRTRGNSNSTLTGHKQNLAHFRTKGEGVSHRKLNQIYLLVLEVLLWRHGSATALHREGALAGAVLGAVPCREPSSVQLLSHVRLLATPWIAARQAPLSITNFRSLPKLMSIESVMPSNNLILCLPLLLPHSVIPSIRVFSNESVLCIRWPKCWSFSFNISPSNEYSGLISFRMGWLDLLEVQGTLKSLLQHHSSKA